MKPYHDITDPKLAKALAHPLRTRLLALLEDRTASPSELADELDASLGVVSYHVRRLTALGFVKLVKRVPRRGAVEHYYTATARPRITDQAWGQTPAIVKEATVSAAIEQVGHYVGAAAQAGGFDDAEAHLTRSPVTVDARGFTELARELERITERVRAIEAESRARLSAAADEGTREATVVLMLFHSAADTPGRAQARRAPASSSAATDRHSVTWTDGRARVETEPARPVDIA